MCALGCSPAPPDYEPEIGEFVERSQYIELWASPGMEVCGGNLAHMDRFIDGFRTLVGPREEAEDFHRFYLLDQEDWDSKGTCEHLPSEAGGCTVAQRTIYSRVVPTVHELVHAEITSGGHTFLEEGIAQVFSETSPNLFATGFDIEEGLDIGGGGLPFEGYERAAHFTRFLIERHGIDGLLALKDETSFGDDSAGIDGALKVSLDSSLDAELAAYEDYPELCFSAGYHTPLVECDLPPTSWVEPMLFQDSVDLQCTSERVLGPVNRRLYAFSAMEIETLGNYRIEVESPGTVDATVWIVKCGSECAHLPREDREYPFEPAAIAIEASAEQPQEQLLYPGKYRIRFLRPVDAPGTVTVRVTAVEI